MVISSFICYRAGEVGSLDLRSSRALIFSNIFLAVGWKPCLLSLPQFPYDNGPSWPSLS